MKHLIAFIMIIFGFAPVTLKGECCGKVDLAPTFVHVDVLESGKTIKKLDMGGVRAESSIRVWKGLCFRPFVLYANGRGELITGGLGIGHCTPVTDKCYITPLVGVNYTWLETTINLRLSGLHLRHLKERFRSLSPYLGIELTYCFTPCFRVYGQYQYIWSRTHTNIKPFFHSKSHSEGPNYSAMVEYDWNDSWSVNFGGAYNESLTREKHGLRGYGFKLGAAYWF